MQVDLITVGAQVLNFLILVLLLRHFLYRRITDAIDQRQSDIAQRTEAADRKRAEAESEAERFRQQRHALDEQRESLLVRAREEARDHQGRMLEQARAEVAQERDEWRGGLRREREALLRDVRERAGAVTYAAVRRALTDLADEDLQRRAVDTFRRRLEEASGDPVLHSAIAEARGGHVIRAPFPLDDGQREGIATLLREHFGVDTEPDFERAPELVLGIQLEAGDNVIGWSVPDYLSAMEEEVDRLLARKAGAGA